ncbi:helix-turn-helix domain-containing protein [Haemophilus influenzae]
MNTIQASKLFESLSSPIRLAIFQQLTAAGSTGMIAGDLAKQLNLAPNNVSFHLKSLLHSGLCVWCRKDGTCVILPSWI